MFRGPESKKDSRVRIFMSKDKGKIHPRTRHYDPEGKYRYSNTLSLTSVLDGMGDQRHAQAALPPAKRSGTHSTRGWVDHRAGLDG
jgi:hypothetical protein